MIMFSGGIEFDTSGDYRVERYRAPRTSDMYYVVGNGALLPVDSALEGYRLIDQLSDRNPVTDKTNNV